MQVGRNSPAAQEATPRVLSRSTVVTTAIGPAEHLRIAVAGWRDRLTYRDVPADEQTPHLLRLQARWRAEETRAVQRVKARVAAYDIDLAGMRARLAVLEDASSDSLDDARDAVAQLPRQHVADSWDGTEGPASLPGRERHVWALERREALERTRLERSTRAERSAATAAARQRQLAVEAEIDGLRQRIDEVLERRATALAQLGGLRGQCVHAYDARAARYLRARSGWGALQTGGALKPPRYSPVEAPPLPAERASTMTPTGADR